MIDLLSLNQKDMEELLKSQGLPAFRGRQLFEWCHKKEVTSFDAMSNLPLQMREWLKENARIGMGREISSLSSQDASTVKFLLEFPDKVQIETVLMRYERADARNRNTLCVSTQAGCAMGCRFCATALGGFQRNLTAGEIVAQVVFADQWLKNHDYPLVSNIVYMGMGEPFLNFDEVMKSIEILNEGKNIGMRRMTVSTAGVIPQIDALAEMESQLNLAISLHAPNDSLRNTLMPINHRYPLAELMASVDRYIAKTHRKVTIEYALFDGINDSEACGLELGKLLKNRLVYVNLLQGNPVKETGLARGSKDTVAMFMKILQKEGVECALRESRGLEIDGACGQLRNRHKNKNFNDK